jgi:hypothetical protein
MESDVTDLPDPDSPTNATTSFLFSEKEIFCRAWVIPDSAVKSTESFFISSKGGKAAIKISNAVLLQIH